MSITRNLSAIQGANVTSPTQNAYTATGFETYADDASFVLVHGAAVAGQTYFNTTYKALREYNGTAWQFDKSFFDTENNTTATGSNQDYAPSTSEQCVRFSSNTLASIRSISPANQRFIIIINDQTTQALTLKNQDVTATAANRIITGTGSDLVIEPLGRSAVLHYDEDSTRWRVIAADYPSGRIEAFASDAAYLVAHPQTPTPAAGAAYFNTTDFVYRIHDGTSFQNSKVLLSVENNTALTGADQDAVPGYDQHIKFSNASLTSIRSISPAKQKFLVITNGTGGVLTIRNQSSGATAANRIITGTAGDITVANDASILLSYDTNSSRWRVIGGSGSGSGSGTGEINYMPVDLESGATTGFATYKDAAAATPVDGTGGSPTTLTLSANSSSPMRGNFDFKVAKSAANSQGEGWSYDFSIKTPDRSKKLKIQFDVNSSDSNYTAGDVVIYVYDVTNAALITPTVTSLPKQNASTWQIQWDSASNSTSYRLIFHWAVTTATAVNLFFDNFIVGPGIVSQGFAGGDWETWTPTGSWVSNATYTGKRRRNGPNMVYEVNIALSGAPTAVDLFITLPTEDVIDTAAIPNANAHATVLGVCRQYDASTATYVGHAVYRNTTTVYLTSGSASNLGICNAVIPFTFGAGDFVTATFEVPITRFSGNGVQNTGLGAQQTFLYNSSGITTAGASDTTAFASGAGGVAIGSINSTTAGSSVTTMRVRLPTAMQQSGMQISVEIFDGQGWFDAAGRFPYVVQGASIYGIRAIGVNSTDIDVQFGNKGCLPSNATYAGDGTAWSAISTQKWRVVVVNPSSPVGYGIADSVSSGLVRPRRGQTALTVTSTVAGWSTVRAQAIYYQDQDGNHRLKFNVTGTVTSGTYTGGDFTLTGVVFKNVAGCFQPVSPFVNSVNAVAAYCNPGLATVTVQHASTASTTRYCFSGDVELDSKPTWA